MSRRQAAPLPASVKKLRCAVYTRKSTEEGLDREFNSLDAQRDACEAYVLSQRAQIVAIPMVCGRVFRVELKGSLKFSFRFRPIPKIHFHRGL